MLNSSANHFELMYDQPFFITEKVSNNAFNYERRTNPKLYVPQLKEGKVEDAKTGEQTVFEDFDDDEKLHTCKGLEHFVKTYFGSIPVYIFDNHNHAFAFWCEQKHQGNLKDNALLVHIDQHKDTRIPDSFISKQDSEDLQKVFHYTNTVLNVGNFIPAAQHIGLVNGIIFLDSLYSLEQMQERLKLNENEGGIPNNIPGSNSNLILDIDLDFFAPDSDYIGNEFKLQIIEKLIPKASVITFATSPYFIEQSRAFDWLHRIAEKV